MGPLSVCTGGGTRRFFPARKPATPTLTSRSETTHRYFALNRRTLPGVLLFGFAVPYVLYRLIRSEQRMQDARVGHRGQDYM